MIFPRAGLRGMALREAAPDLMRTINLVRAAIEAKINTGAPGVERKWFELEAVYDDRAVICLDGRHWSYPYTMTGGVVTVADPQEVVETFVALTEAAQAPQKGWRLIEAEGQASGQVWEATLIQAGVSLNKVFYSDQLLREAAPAFENARICLKGDLEHVKGGAADLRNVVGWADNVRFVEGALPDTGCLVATLTLPGLPEHTRSLLVAASAAGKQDIAGLSIDATGRGVMQMREGKRVQVPTRIERVNSVDLIVEPGAGGRLIRLVEAAPDLSSTGDPEMKLREKMLRFVEAKAPAAYALLDPETVSDDELEKVYREAVAAHAAPAHDAVAAAEQRIRMVEARIAARSAIDASTLPAPAKDRLHRDFAVRERFVEADVTAAIEAERQYLARFVESGRVNVGGFPDVQVVDRSVQMAGMLDAFFDPGHANHRDVHSFREAYIQMTGDTRVTGRMENCDRSRMAESFALREAVDSTTFANALGAAITRRMVQLYAEQVDLQAWRRIASVVPVNDFRTQERFRMGGYGNLPIVAQSGNYGAISSPSDEKATYAVAKRGGTENVTLEAIRNDDVGALRRIPMELALAAANTLHEFVFDFIRTNPTIYDSLALFHATHNNLGTAALSATSFVAARQAMVTQTRAGSGKRLAISPATILVPFELQETAYNLFVRAQNLDKTFVQTINPEVIPVSYWTDANDWALVADPNRCPTIEVGFLDGREEPELFVQDLPNVGSLFSNDTITYKIRHIYGGAVMDYRGLYKAVVA